MADLTVALAQSLRSIHAEALNQVRATQETNRLLALLVTQQGGDPGEPPTKMHGGGWAGSRFKSSRPEPYKESDRPTQTKRGLRRRKESLRA